MILEDLLGYIDLNGESARVSEVCVGLGYTYVQLEDGRVGVSYTLLGRDKAHCTVLHDAGGYTNKGLKETAELVFSKNPLERSIGLAAINASSKPEDGLRGDILKALSVTLEDNVGMVGFFGPLVSPLRSTARTLSVFERNPALCENTTFILPEQEAYDVLPECDVVILTATTLLTGTFDSLVSCLTKAREVVLLGPSCPLFPEVFSKTPVTLLSGILVHDPEGLKTSIREAGGTPTFSRSTLKVNVPTKRRTV